MANKNASEPTYTYQLSSHPRFGFSFEPTNEKTFSKVLNIVEKFGKISQDNYSKISSRAAYLKLSEESLNKLKWISGSISLSEDLNSLYDWYKNTEAHFAPLEVDKKGILTKGKLVLAQESGYLEESQVYIESIESPLYASEIESLLEIHNAEGIVITPSRQELRVEVYEKKT
ncbi:MAG: hypothetical protein GOU98_04355 [Candidatus Altiarchaeota archaeon]|nr:hypothetical protein [Candidatus Altiarchaeota archaeon]